MRFNYVLAHLLCENRKKIIIRLLLRQLYNIFAQINYTLTT